MYSSSGQTAENIGDVHANLVGCTVCDAIYKLSQDGGGFRTKCRRCGHFLTFGRPSTLAWITSLSATNALLLLFILFLPFLELRSGQFDNAVSVINVVLDFSTDIMIPLAVAVFVFILLLPLSRMLLLTYALAPFVLGRRNLPGAERALAWSFRLKPWAMAEIFVLGVAVALVKISDLATINIGPAFWIFVLIASLSVFQDSLVARHTLWKHLSCNR